MLGETNSTFVSSTALSSSNLLGHKLRSIANHRGISVQKAQTHVDVGR